MEPGNEVSRTVLRHDIQVNEQEVGESVGLALGRRRGVYAECNIQTFSLTSSTSVLSILNVFKIGTAIY